MFPTPAEGQTVLQRRAQGSELAAEFDRLPCWDIFPFGIPIEHRFNQSYRKGKLPKTLESSGGKSKKPVP
jgi:hypothetical protein